MRFDLEKRAALARKDRSSKGEIDAPILKLVEHLNSREEFYTTSSCSGRIGVLVPGARKDKARWLLKSHERVGGERLRKALETPPKEKAWLMMEPFILHLTCRSVDDARGLLRCAQASGLKRSGLVLPLDATRVLIEGSDRLSAPLSSAGRLVLGEEALSFLLAEANLLLGRNLARLAGFEKACRQEFPAGDGRM